MYLQYRRSPTCSPYPLIPPKEQVRKPALRRGMPLACPLSYPERAMVVTAALSGLQQLFLFANQWFHHWLLTFVLSGQKKTSTFNVHLRFL